MPPANESASRMVLPVELTTFIGREREVAELRQLLDVVRLLTLTGAGGSGKTRLALEVVKQVAVDTSADVAWVELAALDDATNIARHIAKACGVDEEIVRGGPAVLGNLLSGRNLLLVLDNCEHVVEACADFVDLLLRCSPRLRILATSREALGVMGERAWLVPALPIHDASALFAERARDFAGAFELNEQNAHAVAEICTRLDGIPLAIELAAARVKLLTVEQIRDRLDDAFSLLKSSARTVIPRHRTLGAAIDWSYQLLTDAERALLRRLGVFRGSFSLDAVEALGAADSLDVLARLVDQSLVVVGEHNGVARYTLLETVLQYARQKLAESGEEQEFRRRLAHYVTGIASVAEPCCISAERKFWVERLLPDLDNMRDALAWTREHDPALHVQLAGTLWWFWYSTRHWTEAARVMSDALALPEAAERTRARGKLLLAVGALSALQGKAAPARPVLEEAIDIATEVADAQLLAYAQAYLGMTYGGESRAEGKQLCEAAAAWFEQNGDLYGHNMTLLLLGTTAVGQGAIDEALELTGKAVRVARRLGLQRDLAISLAIHALPLVVRGDYDQARHLLIEAFTLLRKDPSYFGLAMALDYMGEVAGHQGHPLDAARILGAATQLKTVIGASSFGINQARQAAAVKSFRAAAGASAFERAWAEGMQLPADHIVDEILASTSAAAPRALPPLTVVAPPLLRVRALGALYVEVSGEAIAADAWAYAKPKELLVYLLRYPSGSTRDRIARALWPSATPAQLKNSFHVTLHHLRKVLGHAEWIIVDGDRYRLAPTVTYEFDADLFETTARVALQDGRVEALQLALSYYRGDLLEGEVASDWLDEHVTVLRRAYVEVALALGSALETAGQTAAAATIYQQIVARDDLEEVTQRRLLACWAQLGEVPKALRHYEQLVTTLRAVLNTEPEPETIALYERIRAGLPIDHSAAIKID